MQCPYCKKEMGKGLLQSGKMMLWTRKKHYLSLRPKGDDLLLDENYLTGTAVPAWICRSCQKILIDYANEQEEI